MVGHFDGGDGHGVSRLDLMQGRWEVIRLWKSEGRRGYESRQQEVVGQCRRGSRLERATRGIDSGGKEAQRLYFQSEWEIA